jgi:phage shock protein A
MRALQAKIHRLDGEKADLRGEVERLTGRLATLTSEHTAAGARWAESNQTLLAERDGQLDIC